MPDRLDFDSARRVLEEVAPTDTWDEATLRAATGSLVQLDAEDATVSTLRTRARRSRTIRLVSIAACLLAVVAVVAALVVADQPVDTVPAQTTECPSSTQPGAITQGAQMNKRFVAPVVSAATAILLLGACGDDDDSSPPTSEAADDDSTILAKGEDIELVGEDGLAGQTLNIDAEQENGEVTGEFRISENVFTLECVDRHTDGFVILGGKAASDDFAGGELAALIIRENGTTPSGATGPTRSASPDSVHLYANDSGAESCRELVESIPDDLLRDDSGFVDVEDGYDIETR